MMKTLAKTLLLTVLLTGGGCSSSSGNKNSDGGAGNSWLPLKVGYRWEYLITSPTGKVDAKVQGVTAEEAVGGAGDAKGMTAFKLVTGNRFNDPEGDVSYQGVVDARVVRFRELSIDGSSGAVKKEEYYAQPWKLRLDMSEANTMVGAQWPESYKQFEVDTPRLPANDGGTTAAADGGAVTDASAGAPVLVTTMTQPTDVWTVVAVDESVVVPAATFKTLVVKRIANSGLGSEKTFWFARGIGKVKETGVGEQTEELQKYDLRAAVSD